MNLKREQEYIKNYIEKMTDEEFEKVMEECGNEVILPTINVNAYIQKKRSRSRNFGFSFLICVSDERKFVNGR